LLERYRVVFASDRTGSWELYSALLSGRRLAQLTFERQTCVARTCGVADPVPSPDGRLIAYTHGDHRSPGGPISVVGADGRGARELVGQYAVDPAWSPDSRRIAYSSEDGIRVVSVKGRRLARLTTGNDCAPAWAPEGRRLLFVRAKPGQASCTTGTLMLLDGKRLRTVAPNVGDAHWSRDGRWIAFEQYEEGGNVPRLVVARPDGTAPRIVSGVGHLNSLEPAWSPDGRTLAFVRDGIRAYDVRTRRRRVLVRDVYAFRPEWSSRGEALVYHSGSGSDQAIRVVALGGHARTVYRSYPYGGDAADAYLIIRRRLRMRPVDEVAPPAETHGEELWTNAPVVDLAADGDRVAVVWGSQQAMRPHDCAIGVWRPQPRRFVPIGLLVPRGCTSYDASVFATWSLALAGSRVAWVEESGGIGVSLELETATLARPFPEHLGSGGGCCAGGNPFGGTHIGDAVGGEGMLVFSTWTTACTHLPCPGLGAIDKQTIWRVGDNSGMCLTGGTAIVPTASCTQVATADGALAPLDVDGGRIVSLRGDGSLTLLDATGKAMRTIPSGGEPPLAAELDGDRLVVLVRGALGVYDVQTGALAHAWPLPDVPSSGACRTYVSECVDGVRLRLVGAGGGLAAYLFDGAVHVLRLVDGRDVAYAPASAAQLTRAGLFFAHTAGGAYPGRLLFAPLTELDALG
jgi:WD40 repeat protein